MNKLPCVHKQNSSYHNLDQKITNSLQVLQNSFLSYSALFLSASQQFKGFTQKAMLTSLLNSTRVNPRTANEWLFIILSLNEVRSYSSDITQDIMHLSLFSENENVEPQDLKLPTSCLLTRPHTTNRLQNNAGLQRYQEQEFENLVGQFIYCAKSIELNRVDCHIRHFTKQCWGCI